MILTSLLAAAFTFTATATGVEKGTPVEFLIAGQDSDRDYETMFILDGSVEEFCRGLEKAGVPRGCPQDQKNCRLWPTGCTLTLTPSLETYVESFSTTNRSAIIYTGGIRNEKGAPVANSEMPRAVFALYTLNQSPLLFNGIFDQGLVYNTNRARVKLRKGERVTFTLTWDGATKPKPMSVTFHATNSVAVLKSIKDAASTGEVDLQVAFDGELTVQTATALAQALAVIDSPSVKINGRGKDQFFYRTFLPSVSWRDRQERVMQPFELHVESGEPKLLFIDEDWSVDGPDPKLTERVISISDAKKHPKTDTCLIFCKKEQTLATLTPYLRSMPSTVINWYIYGD